MGIKKKNKRKATNGKILLKMFLMGQTKYNWLVSDVNETKEENDQTVIPFCSKK